MNGDKDLLDRGQRSYLRPAIGALSSLIFLGSVLVGPMLQPTALEVGFVLSTMIGILLVLVLATARPTFALMLTALFFLTISAIGHFKQVYLGNSFLASDIYYFSGGHVLSTILKFPMLWKAIVAWVVIPIPLLILSWRYSWRPLAGIGGIKTIAIRVLGTLCAVLLVCWVLAPKGPYSRLFGKSMWEAINQDAHLTSFFMSINAIKIVLPNVHNTPAQNAAWDGIAADIMAKNRPTKNIRPDIVIVLEESTFDPSTLPACDIPECINHQVLIDPDPLTRASGAMRSYVYGGGTALSEFDVLTGLPYGIFGLAGGYAPWSVAPRIRDSLPMQLSRFGYKNVAVYTVEGGYMNAQVAYEDYGFDEFHDAPSLGLPAWGATDQEMFKSAENVYTQLRAKTDRPIFMMLKTIAQHGPHNNHSLDSLPAPYNKGLFPHLSADQQLNLSDYLAHLDASNKAMAGLQEFFLHRDRPTILLTFGDHKPSFSGVMSEFKIVAPAGYNDDPKYLTYFKLDSNFATPDLPKYPATAIAFLPGLVLQAAGLPLDKFFAATEHLRNACNGLFVACSDHKVLYGYYAWLFSDHKVFQ